MKKTIFFVCGMAFLIIAAVLCGFFLKKTKNPVGEIEAPVIGKNTGNTLVEKDTGYEVDEPIMEVSSMTMNEKYNILPSIDDKITADSMRCGTFQLVWNDMVNNIVKQDVVFNPQLQVVKNLNKQTFSDQYLSPNSYYSKFGLLTLDLKDEIEKGIKEKFNETSDILDQIDRSDVPQSDDAYKGANEKKYGFYAMLKKIFNFENAFDELNQGDFDGKYKNIDYFGIDGRSSEILYDQVYVYYYNSDDDFAVALKTKEGEDIILARGFEGDSFLDIYKIILLKKAKYNGKHSFTENDYLKIPNLKVKTLQEFNELENKIFYSADGMPCNITKALQTIEFELNKSGGYIKSEAWLGMVEGMAMPEEIEYRYFYFNKPFIMFWKESDKDLPYFAAQISDITLFQE